MVWVKLSDDFPIKPAELKVSDASFRTHVEGLCWVMKQENAGLVSESALKRLAETENPQQAVQELVDKGLWKRIEGGYQILHHMELQIEPEVLAIRREKDNAKHRAQRMRGANGPARPSKR
jgi:hypothetical protein